MKDVSHLSADPLWWLAIFNKEVPLIFMFQIDLAATDNLTYLTAVS